MAEVSIGGAVGEGFSLIRKRPGVVLVWGLIYMMATAAVLALLAPGYIAMFAAFSQAAAHGAPPTLTGPAMQNMMRVQSLTYLYDIFSLLLAAVINCAVFRAVLHPRQGRWAYLRIGAPELFLFILIIGALFCFFIGMVVAMIPIGIVAAILAGAHAGAVGAIVGLAGFIAAFVVGIYLSLRVSLVGPMMVDDGKFHLTEAWALTRGKVASLFAMALVVFLILAAAELVIGLILAAIGMGVLSSMAGGLSGLPALFKQPPQQLFGKLAPLLALLAVVWVPLTGCAMAIMGAPWARAYRDLRPPRDIAETFA
jgi:hypothetical protein